MKQFKFVVASILLMIGAVNTWAEDAKPSDLSIHAILTSVQFSCDNKIVEHVNCMVMKPEDYPNGLFVRVKELFGDRPAAASIFAAKLNSLGFKIANRVENADVVLLITSPDINFKAIDKNSDGVDARKADLVIGAVGSAIATGGLSLFNTDWSGFGNSRPTMTGFSVVFQFVDKSKKDFQAGVGGLFKADEGGIKASMAQYELTSNEWLKVHVASLSNASPTPASAVLNSKTMNEAAAK